MKKLLILLAVAFALSGFFLIESLNFGREYQPNAFNVSCEKTGSANESISVLLVGNSLMNGVPAKLRKLLNCSGYDVDIAISNPGGYWLHKHDQNDKTLSLISRGYDWVLLQEQSGGITRHVKPYDTISSLKSKINAAGSKMGLYQTWAFSSRDPKVTKNIIGRYENIGKHFGAPVFAIGRAWNLYYKEHPKQPFTLFSDKVHASQHGQCLISYLLYSYLTGKSPVVLDSLGLSENDAAILQRIAWQTFRAYPPFH